MVDVQNISNKINENKTDLIETPTNPMMNIIDVKSIVEIAKNSGIKVAVDNTFATPYLQRPLELGADIVMHSVTKYLENVYSDVVMGALVTNDESIKEEMIDAKSGCCLWTDGFILGA